MACGCADWACHRRTRIESTSGLTENLFHWVLMGEIGGTDEEEAALFIRRHVRKPVVAFIAGQTAPAGKED